MISLPSANFKKKLNAEELSNLNAIIAEVKV